MVLILGGVETALFYFRSDRIVTKIQKLPHDVPNSFVNFHVALVRHEIMFNFAFMLFLNACTYLFICLFICLIHCCIGFSLSYLACVNVFKFKNITFTWDLRWWFYSNIHIYHSIVFFSFYIFLILK